MPNKVITHSFSTDTIVISLISKNGRIFGALNEKPFKEIKDPKTFISEYFADLGEEEIHFICGFFFMIEKQNELKSKIDNSLKDLIGNVNLN